MPHIDTSHIFMEIKYTKQTDHTQTLHTSVIETMYKQTDNTQALHTSVIETQCTKDKASKPHPDISHIFY